MARPDKMAAGAAKPSKNDKKATAVKDGRVTKPTSSDKSSKKSLAPVAAAKAVKKEKSAKKVKKEPTPVSDSSDDSDADDSDVSDDSEVDAAPKTNGFAKMNGADVKKPTDSDESDDDSDVSSDDSDTETKPPAKINGKANGTAVVNGGDSDDSSDSEADSDDSDAPAGGAAAKGAGAAADSSDEDSDDDNEGSDDSDESSEGDDDDEPEVPAKKRKATADEQPAAKKAKTTAPANATKNLFVGNLTWNIDDDWLQREFSEYGECTARVMTGPDGRSKGFGFVEFTDPEHAVLAHDARKGTELDNRPMNVDYSTPRGEVADRSQRTNQRADKFGDSKSSPSDNLFVGNISFGATAEMLQEAFEQYGTVTRVHLPTDMETGALKGFGYIGMGSVDEAKAALEAMNGADIEGRAIRLDFATPRPERSEGGGRGGFGGGGFRGGRGGGRGGRGDFGGGRGRGGFGGRGGGRGGRGGAPRGRGGSTNRGGFGDFSGQKVQF